MSEQKIYRFMSGSKVALGLSLTLILISLVSLAVRGLNLGLDFTGGTVIEVEYAQPPRVDDVRRQLEQAGYNKVVVQKFGSDRSILIRLAESQDDKVGQKVVSALEKDGQQVTLKRAEFVGAQIGDELREKGGMGLLLALAMIMLYVAFRFQLKFSVGAVAALIHDVIITVGFFSVFQWEFDLNVLAAVLAIIGYSLNDTIVVSDRIRENFRKIRKGSVEEVIDISLTETLARTIVTGLTTLLTLIALYFLGGDALHGFSQALIIGVVVGTYSSIYVASALLLVQGISREDLALPVKNQPEDGVV
ncbi:protein translocase subunit SecF [Hahella sp. SMD15-11]|uniref:Protein-export membrane protein SecF n=1 Tax=Thermohahella caldifontis TaxID=3142973 RepID=A0AB39UYQ1_9GAMM